MTLDECHRHLAAAKEAASTVSYGPDRDCLHAEVGRWEERCDRLAHACNDEGPSGVKRRGLRELFGKG